MKIKFKDLRDIVSKTECISLLLRSDDDTMHNFLHIGEVPHKYDLCDVVGVGRVSGISIEGLDGLFDGVEILLDDKLPDLVIGFLITEVMKKAPGEHTFDEALEVVRKHLSGEEKLLIIEG